MQDSTSLVGLDVHASLTHAAIVDPVTAELRGVRLRWRRALEVVEFLGTLAGQVRAVYEALGSMSPPGRQPQPYE